MLGSENRRRVRKNGAESTRTSDYDITRPLEAIQSQGCSTISEGSPTHPLVSRVEGENFARQGTSKERSWTIPGVIFIESNLVYYLLGWTRYLLYISCLWRLLWIFAPVRIFVVLIFVILLFFLKSRFCFCLSLSSSSSISYGFLEHLSLLI